LKVVMVNDCSFVGENIIKYLPEEFQVTHIKRTRGLWSKTGGIFWKILHAKADIFHTHYLLQDSYLTLKLKKKPVVAHAHGSDIRSTLHSKKWGWIVKYIIKNADRVLLSSLDVLEKLKAIRDDVIYIPIPIDVSSFIEKPFRNHNKIIVFHPYNSLVRGTDKVVDSFKLLDLAYPKKFEFLFLEKHILHEEMQTYYHKADIVVTDLGVGALSTCSLEAMACGRPVIQYIKDGIYSEQPPVLNVDDSYLSLFERLVEITKSEIIKYGKLGRRYIKQFHNAEVIAKQVGQIYEEVT